MKKKTIRRMFIEGFCIGFAGGIAAGVFHYFL